MKKPAVLVEAVELRVVHFDESFTDYRSIPFDVIRAERIASGPASTLLGYLGGLTAIAFSCALRAGDFHRLKNESEAQTFERYQLEQVAVVMHLEEIEEAEVVLTVELEDDDDPPTPAER